jgi:hypothetical protein
MRPAPICYNVYHRYSPHTRTHTPPECDVTRAPTRTGKEPFSASNINQHSAIPITYSIYTYTLTECQIILRYNSAYYIQRDGNNEKQATGVLIPSSGAAQHSLFFQHRCVSLIFIYTAMGTNDMDKLRGRTRDGRTDVGRKRCIRPFFFFFKPLEVQNVFALPTSDWP